MNRIVKAWDKHESRKMYEGLDSVDIDDDQKVTIKDTETMAERQNREGEVKSLSSPHFNNVIKYVRETSVGGVGVLKFAVETEMRRLKLKGNPEKSVDKTPDGSSQVSVGSIVAWMKKVNRRNKKDERNARKQIVAIHATCCARCE